MHPYALLGFAIAAEVAGTTALKLSDGMSRLIPSLGVVVAYGISFWLLSMTLRSLPIGFTYAVWSGVGIAGIAVLGWVVFGEALNLKGVLGLGLIVAGIVVLQMSTQAVH